MDEILCEIKNDHPKISWDVPDGGMALWLNTGEDSSSLAMRAREKKILLHPERNFLLDSKDGTHLRLGFSGQTPAENIAGLKALSIILRK
jgi:DNA-binding transcriptional MocR family regulator